MTDTTTPAPLAFVDTETTGTNPFFHEVWEIAVIVDGVSSLWHVEPDLRKADPMALQICKYYERRGDVTFLPKDQVAAEVAAALAGRHMVGMVPSFDATFIERFLRNNAHSPAWHYHLVDVEALIAGRLGVVPPWKSKELSLAIGIDPEHFVRHSAMGDAEWTKACFERVMDASFVLPARLDIAS